MGIFNKKKKLKKSDPKKEGKQAEEAKKRVETLAEFEQRMDKSEQERREKESLVNKQGGYKVETIQIGYCSGVPVKGSEDEIEFSSLNDIRRWVRNSLLATNNFGWYSATFPWLFIPFKVEFVDGDKIIRITKITGPRDVVEFDSQARDVTEKMKNFLRSLP